MIRLMVRAMVLGIMVSVATLLRACDMPCTMTLGEMVANDYEREWRIWVCAHSRIHPAELLNGGSTLP